MSALEMVCWIVGRGGPVTLPNKELIYYAFLKATKRHQNCPKLPKNVIKIAQKCPSHVKSNVSGTVYSPTFRVAGVFESTNGRD